MNRSATSVLLIALVLGPVIIFSQELNKKITDPKNGKEILYGYCDRAGLEKGEFGEMFEKYYKTYEPDKAVTDKLKLTQAGI